METDNHPIDPPKTRVIALSWFTHEGNQVLLAYGEKSATPPAQPLGAPATNHRAGDCPECQQHIDVWLDYGGMRSHGHEPGCRFLGAADALLQSWGVEFPAKTDGRPSGP